METYEIVKRLNEILEKASYRYQDKLVKKMIIEIQTLIGDIEARI